MWVILVETYVKMKVLGAVLGGVEPAASPLIRQWDTQKLLLVQISLANKVQKVFTWVRAKHFDGMAEVAAVVVGVDRVSRFPEASRDGLVVPGVHQVFVLQRIVNSNPSSEHTISHHSDNSFDFLKTAKLCNTTLQVVK